MYGVVSNKNINKLVWRDIIIWAITASCLSLLWIYDTLKLMQCFSIRQFAKYLSNSLLIIS